MYVISRARPGVISAKLCTLQGIKSSLSALRPRVLSAVKNAFNVSSCINRDRSRVFRASPHNGNGAAARGNSRVSGGEHNGRVPARSEPFSGKSSDAEDPIIAAAHASSKLPIELFHASDPDNFPSLEFGSINRGQRARV